MEHTEVVNLINKWAPEMRAGDAGEVLLQKASAWRDPENGREMPVAVLEKAAQTFNQGIVLQGMKDGDRGGDQNLIQIDKLITDYVSPQTGKSSSDTGGLRARPASTFAVPDIRLMIAHPQTIAKSAAAEIQEPAPVAPVDPTVYQEFADDARAQLFAKLAQWQHRLLDSGMIEQVGRHAQFTQFGRVEADALRMDPPRAKAAALWLEDYWKQSPLQVAVRRADSNDLERHKIAHDFTGEAAALIEIGDLVQLWQASGDLAKQAATDVAKFRQENPRNPDRGSAGSGGTPNRPSPPKSPDKGKQKPGDSGKSQGPLPLYQFSGKGPEKEDAKGKGGEKSAPASGAGLSKGVGTALGPLKLLIEKNLGGIIPEPGYNGGQQRVDDAASQVQHIHNLQRLMVEDPVISKADPKTIGQLFSSVINTSPHVATDYGLLRFQMREMLQYGGMPVDSAKQLAQTETAIQGVREGQRRENDLAYGPGNKTKPKSKEKAA